MTTSETDTKSTSGESTNGKSPNGDPTETVREQLDLWISGSEEPEEVELWDIDSTDEGAQEMQRGGGSPSV